MDLPPPDERAVRLEAGRLLFHATEAQRQQLVSLGYEPLDTNPLQVFSRVVQVARRSVEDTLVALGASVINREEDYWVVRGTLEQLRTLERLGYRLAPLVENEPRPREVRIIVPESADVQRVNAIHVDIFSVEETEQGFII